MSLRRWPVFAVACALLATDPNRATRRWWAHVTALSNDSLQGRDTGSEGYRKSRGLRVSRWHFQRNELKPAGEHGFYQTVPLHEVRFRADRSTVELARANGTEKLEWLRQISIPVRLGTPESIAAPLVFGGSGEAPEGLDLTGKIRRAVARRRRRGTRRSWRRQRALWDRRDALHRHHRRPRAAALAGTVRRADDGRRCRCASGTWRWSGRRGFALQPRVRGEAV